MGLIWGKILGKLFSYLGLVISVAGIVWENAPLLIVGLLTITVGCIIHEVNEK